MPPQAQPLPQHSSQLSPELIQQLARALHEIQQRDQQPDHGQIPNFGPGNGPADLMRQSNEGQLKTLQALRTPQGQHAEDPFAPQGLDYLKRNGPQDEMHRMDSSQRWHDLGEATRTEPGDWRSLLAQRQPQPLGNIPGYDFTQVTPNGGTASVHFLQPGEAPRPSTIEGQPSSAYFASHPDWSHATAGPTWGNPNSEFPGVQALNRSDALASGRAGDYGAVFSHPQGPQNFQGPETMAAAHSLGQRYIQEHQMSPGQAIASNPNAAGGHFGGSGTPLSTTQEPSNAAALFAHPAPVSTPVSLALGESSQFPTPTAPAPKSDWVTNTFGNHNFGEASANGFVSVPQFSPSNPVGAHGSAAGNITPPLSGPPNIIPIQDFAGLPGARPQPPTVGPPALSMNPSALWQYMNPVGQKMTIPQQQSPLELPKQASSASNQLFGF